MNNHLKRSMLIMLVVSTVIEIAPRCGAPVTYIWHNGEKHILRPEYHATNDQIAPQGYLLEITNPDGTYYEEFIHLNDQELTKALDVAKPDSINTARREADRRIWHNNAWRVYKWEYESAAQGHKDVPVVHGRVKSYMLDDKFITFPTAAELAISDAKKELWHKGAWHDAVWKDNAMNSYVDGDTFVTLTPEELAISDAKRAEKEKAQQK